MHVKVKRWLVISGVLFLASLIGVFTVFAQSSEVEQETKLLDYEHQGRFSYLAYQKASYLFDDFFPETEESPETEENSQTTEIPKIPISSPKYPIEITDRFDITFTYQLVSNQDELVTRISEEVEVMLSLRKPDEAAEEIVLVPNSTQTGSFTVNFSLEASELAVSTISVIKVKVYTTIETATGPIFESFNQNLIIESNGPLIELDEDLSSIQQGSFGELIYWQIGEFDYSVRLKSNSPWGAIEIGPPPVIPSPSPPPPSPPPPLSSKVLGPKDIIFFNLLERIDMTYHYRLLATRPLKQVTSKVVITAVLEGVGVWSKRYPLLSTEESGDFDVNFTLDLFKYLELLQIIRQETGTSAEAGALSIIVDVHTTAETGFGPIDEVFSQTLSTVLENSAPAWNDELLLTKPGSIKATSLIPNPNKYLGLSLGGVRTLSTTAMVVFFLSLLFSVVLYVRFKPVKPSPSQGEALRVQKKYGKLMAEATVHTPMEGEMIISLSSIEDLTRIADELAKPIIHQVPDTSKEQHIYYVIDGLTRYQYILSINVEE
jgi:hypothetical protein